ncbi:tetratricopeptide repeat protein [Tenacibaculum halocynthiae]|uniref:tetratricopeptide repeat protein n=1 Tax=Tenacibaculum halocynthiae TaxID=1254437 RepID=UPI003D64B475
MKKAITIIFLLTSYFILGQQLNTLAKDNKGKPMLLGKTNKKAFENENFKWFKKNYDSYLTNDKIINQLKDSIQNYTIKAFYGSWCGDSKRELPKFYKVIDETHFNKSQLEVIAVDKKSEAYKASPNGEEKGLNIHRVPTFIFYKNNKEVARIVEYPKQDFERDILTIISGEKYSPQYIVVEYLHKMLEKKTIKELKNEENKLAASLAEFTKGSRELNTYGYKLLRSNQLEKAVFVFELNTKMYPYKANVFDSLGEAYFTTKNYNKALSSYNKAQKLDPNDKNIANMIKKIKTEINQ